MADTGFLITVTIVYFSAERKKRVAFKIERCVTVWPQQLGHTFYLGEYLLELFAFFMVN